MTVASNINFWAVAGMVYALAGAALFFNASFANPIPSLATAGASAPVDGHVLRRQVAQWLDSRIGVALLVVGFFLQLTGTAGTTTLNKAAVFVLLGLAGLAALYALARDLFVEDLIARTAHTEETASASEVLELPAPAASEPSPAVGTPEVLEYRANGTGG